MKSTFLLTFLLLAGFASSANILAIFPIYSKSHYVFPRPLFKELALSGHNVTVLTVFKTSNLPPNYHELYVDLPESCTAPIDSFKKRVFSESDDSQLMSMTKWGENMYHLNKCIFSHPVTQSLMKTDQKFDLLIFEIMAVDAFAGFAHLLKVPVIGVSAVKATTFLTEYTGSPVPTSFVPQIYSQFQSREMGFFDRLQNFMMAVVGEIITELYMKSYDKRAYEEFFPDPKPEFEEAKKNAMSLVLINSHVSFTGPQPLMSNVIEVGGMQLQTKNEPLPKDMQAFLDDAPNGVVYFCLGSNLEASYIDEKKRSAIVKVLGKLKEKVILKWDHPESIAHIPKGKFFTAKWMPQADILAHPNVKVFISHGGFIGTTETTYHGVPVVTIPIFGDQQHNAQEIANLGIGVRLDYTNITDTSFEWAVHEILRNPSYTRNMKEMAERFKDRPQAAMETAKWWVEYVIRHKGARFLRSPALKLTYWQYYSIDIGVFLAAVVLFAVLAVRAVLKCGMRVLFGKKEKVKKA